MQTNIQLMISMPHMDKGSSINYDIEEKQINLGNNLISQEITTFNDDFTQCEQETLKELLFEHQNDFKMLYNLRNDEINKVIS